MAAEPHVCDGIDLKWMYASDSEEEDDWSSNSPVVLTQELSLKGKIRRILFRNARTRLGSTLFDIIVKLTLCVLYITRIQFDEVELYACGGSPCGENNTYQIYPDNNDDGMIFSSAEINWITDTGHLGSSQDALSLSQSVNCGWSKQQPLGATHHYVICPRPSY